MTLDENSPVYTAYMTWRQRIEAHAPKREGWRGAKKKRMTSGKENRHQEPSETAEPVRPHIPYPLPQTPWSSRRISLKRNAKHNQVYTREREKERTLLSLEMQSPFEWRTSSLMDVKETQLAV
jgi:hypothetical protein